MKRLLLAMAFAMMSVMMWAADGKKVAVIPIDTEIGSTSWRYLQKGFEMAQQVDADVVLLHINTYGGTVEHADSMRTMILASKRPVVAFIDNNAASAGALISIACDSIFMCEGANIGAATVVNQSGEAMPDKYQSYMRSIMRSTAQSHGKVKEMGEDSVVVTRWFRNPLVAEAMVDPRTAVPEVGDDSTRVVTFTASEAVKYHFSEGIEQSVEGVIENRLGYEHYEVITYEPSFIDRLVGFFGSGAVQAILIMIIVGGIYFELQSPGIGFPSLAAVVAAVLYFSPLYIDGLAQSWEIIAFALGVLLILLEVFVIPGFGIAGISGIVLVFVSLVFALIGNVSPIDFGYTTNSDIMIAMIIVMAGFLLGVALILYVSHKIGSKGIMRDSALQLEQRVEDGYIGVPTDINTYIGMQGTAHTVLRPSGKVKMPDGKVVDAVSMGDFIDAGSPVKVVKYENTQLYVEKA
ncbi:MAG: nodulation protein NfeD [Muribaculaceae bacterium]